MLNWLPVPLHRAVLRLGHGARKLWWRVAKPDLDGCSVIGLDQAGRVLLVRHSYGAGLWCLPGGGIGRSEAAEHAAAREWHEEISCDLDGLRALGVFEHRLHGARNRVHLFAGTIRGTPKADGREIAEICLFARDALPDRRSRTVDERLAHLADGPA
jgi:8-oxo-dGTP pyrophosphatase MutT (NUDIX family)